MSIELKVREVEKLFDQLDTAINQFKTETNLHCQAGCGKCCTHNQVDASPLEFLPWAFHAFLNGEAEQQLDELNKATSVICHLYRPIGLLESGSGSCSNYIHRGLICRLFGYGANTDKYGKLRLATCKFIKEDQALFFIEAEERISAGLPVPIFTHYYMQLSQIDFYLGHSVVPINQALKLALEAVLQYYAYRPVGGMTQGVA